MVGISMLIFSMVYMLLDHLICFWRVCVQVDMHHLRLWIIKLVVTWQSVEVYMNCRHKRTRLRITRLYENIGIVLDRLWERSLRVIVRI